MNQKCSYLFCFIFLSHLCGQGFWGNEFPEAKIEYDPRNYVCYKTDTPILIDGKINDSGWSNVEWTESFVDIEGSLKPDPYFDTKAKMGSSFIPTGTPSIFNFMIHTV